MTLEIKRADKGTDLADRLICFVESFSWEEVKEHMLGELREWAFTDRETPFAAEVNGFDKTYIPSIHTGLYEKYGYSYLRDIVNYGGGTDRLYVKKIKQRCENENQTV